MRRWFETERGGDVPTSTDFPQDEGIVRQFDFGYDEAVVIDVTSEFVVVNWTSRVNAVTFIDLITELEDPPLDSDSWFRLANQLHEGRTSFSSICNGRRTGYLESCQFLRVDISETRSVAWELAGSALRLTGLGDDTSIFASGETDVLATLIQRTATTSVTGHEVLESAVTLAREYGQGAESVAGMVYT